MTSPKNVKLQNSFVPVGYNLSIRPDLSTWSYEADEAVTLRRCPENPHSDTIQLHAAPSMEIVSVDGATLVERDATAHTLVLKLDNATSEEVVLRFHFKHAILKELRGFYRVTFEHEGKEHRMASTHFEPVSARLFYICQDEPAQRADFTLTVSLPQTEKHYTVLSNGPLLTKEEADGLVVHRFQMVPRCPPYLTACVVGELEYVETVVNSIPVRVYTSLGKVDRAGFALETTAFALDFFEKFFNCKFPLPKLDVVAVPDFPIGGMENWGCIACVESILLDPTKSSVGARKRASELVCHEVSHNWFGNLVAINWWEGLWLKEGFASWCGNYASHVRDASWKSLEDAAQHVAGAMDVDMYDHSHPVEVPIRDPGDITQIFDLISYDKGMGLVFMLEAFLGDKWAPAAAHYINKYAYKDTKTVQLWEALEESAKMPITEAMNSFTTQMGYPVVHVERVADNKVTLRQQPCRFATTKRTGQQTWCIPMVLEGITEAAGRVTVMLRGSEPMEVVLPASLAASPFITANPRRSGFYRCRYDDATFKAWVAEYGNLSVADRRAIISDTAACISAGFDDVERLASLVHVVRQTERDTDVLGEFNGSVRGFFSAFEDSDLRKGTRRTSTEFFLPLAESFVKMKPSSTTEELVRSFFLNTALGILLSDIPVEEAATSSITEWAVEEAQSFLKGGEYAAATLGKCLAAYLRLDTANSAAARSEELYAKFLTVDGNDELCRALIYGMCMSPSVEFATGILHRCVENDRVRSQYGGNVYAALSANPSFKENALWEDFKTNFDRIDAQWGGGQFRIQLIVSLVGSTLSGEACAKEFEAFFQSHPLPNARLAIGRATEDIRLRAWVNAKWKTSLATIMRAR